jgi:HAMP domain-containing protein
MAILERLLFLYREIRALAYDFNGSPDTATHTLTERFAERLRQRFKGLVLITETGNYMPVLGRIDNPPHKPTPAQTQYLNVGKTVVSSRHHPNMPSQIFIMHSVDPQCPKRGILLGEIDTIRLWGIGHMDTLPPMTELCILDELNNVLLSSLSLPETFAEHVAAKTDGSEHRRFMWKHGNKEYLASYWSIFLKTRFFIPKWTVVLSQSKADATAPLADFKKIFPLVVLVSLGMVVLLSSIQIRRSLVPLEKLKEGTERIALRDFDSQVTVTSGDEFEELAVSFNTMSKRLGKQFNTLTTIAEIDNAILAALDTERIIETVLMHMRDVLPCDVVSVTLIDSNEANLTRTYARSHHRANKSRVKTAELDPEDIRRLRGNPEWLLIEGDKGLPQYLQPLANGGIIRFKNQKHIEWKKGNSAVDLE